MFKNSHLAWESAEHNHGIRTSKSNLGVTGSNHVLKLVIEVNKTGIANTNTE